MKINKLIFAISIAFIISSCSKQQSSVTGWDYNNSKNGGFEVKHKIPRANDWAWINLY